MNRKLQTSVVFICSVFLLSCKKDDSNPAGPDTQPLTPGTAIVTYNDSRSGGHIGGSSSAVCTLNRDSSIVLDIYSGDPGAAGSYGEEMKICRPLGLQKYTLGPGSCSYYAYYTIWGGGAVTWATTQKSEGSGFINVSYLDFNSKTVSGTFAAHIYEGGSTTDFTNGTFKGTWR
jgi:hypothetical protein